MRKLLKGFLNKRDANKHLLFIDSQSMLLLFSCATMVQFLFSWKHIDAFLLIARSIFLTVSLIIYVASRTMKQHQQDILVVVVFSSFVLYRVFGENLANVIQDVGGFHLQTYWVIVILYICTGIPMKLLLTVTFAALVGLLVQVSLSAEWERWFIDVPLFFAFWANGIMLYYTFFCIGVEICRVRHRPSRAMADLPPNFFTDLEPKGLKSLPLTVLGKTFSREEHLYILLRVTQMPAFREAALQLIGEDSQFDLSLPDKDKLERGFLRSALLQFHLKECQNPALRRFAGVLGDVGFETVVDAANLITQSNRSLTIGTSNDDIIVGLAKKSSANGGLIEPKFSGRPDFVGEHTRLPLEALASKISRQSDGRRLTHRGRPSVSSVESIADAQPRSIDASSDVSPRGVRTPL